MRRHDKRTSRMPAGSPGRASGGLTAGKAALCILALTAASSGFAQPNPARYSPQETYHVVRRGENLTVVARKYGVSVEELASLNNLDDRDLLPQGRRLRVPTRQRPAPRQPVVRQQVPPSERRISMSFSDTDVRDVLAQIAEYAQVDIVLTPGATGNVSVSLRNRTAGEAILLVAAAAGHTVSRVGGAYLVGPAAEVQKASGEFGRAELVPLRYITAQNAVSALSSIVRTVRAEASGQSVIISGSPQDLAAARAALAQIDVPPTPVAPPAPETQTYSIQNIDPELAERVLLRAYPDLRIVREGRALIITGLPATIQAASRSLQTVDVAPVTPPAAPEEIEYEVYKLKYLNAEVAVEALTKALPTTVKVAVAPEPGAPPQANFNPLSTGLLGGSGSGSGGSGGFGGSGGGGFGGGGQSGGQTGGNQGGQGGQGGGAQEQKLSRATRLIIIGPRSGVAAARELIAQTDVPQPLVRIEAAIIEVNRNNVKDLGVEWDFDGAPISFRVPGGSGLDVRGAPTRSPVDFTATLRALITKGHARLLASPNISVVDREDANIFIGDLRRFPGRTTVVGNVGTVQDIETIPVGIILLVRPYIHDDGAVTLKVHPVVSSVTGFDAGLPRTSSREADTTVRLLRGEELVIGGLTSTDTIRSETRVPILGDIPILGELFRSRNRTDRKTEIIVIIRAYPVLTDAAPQKDFRKGVEDK